MGREFKGHFCLTLRSAEAAGRAAESTKEAIASIPLKDGRSGLWYFAIFLFKEAFSSDIKVSERSFKSGYGWILDDLDSNWAQYDQR